MATLVIAAPPPAVAEPPITSGAFWPAIDPMQIREDQRIDSTVTPQRLKAALIEAIATTNHALSSWRTAQQAAGCTTLADVAAEEIDGQTVHVHRYLRAVGCLTKALLLERLRDIDTTGKGHKDADALTEPVDDCRRDHLNALADITGRPRNTVELI
ncbi:MAG: head completion/stabilization protein [Proteobacteria bacterium]|nr:head completion/stabilization protein [Pseudomonadota bacterium]